MKILNLTIKKQWFDMIGNGKEEEYRDLKPHWISRLMTAYPDNIGGHYMDEHKCIAYLFNRFDQVLFANGGHFGDVPKKLFECKGIEIREGRQEWGAEPGKKYFVIKLGKQIK